MRNFESAKASVEMEGFIITEKIEELVKKEVSGEITFEQFKKELDRLAENV